MRGDFESRSVKWLNKYLLVRPNRLFSTFRHFIRCKDFIEVSVFSSSEFFRAGPTLRSLRRVEIPTPRRSWRRCRTSTFWKSTSARMTTSRRRRKWYDKSSEKSTSWSIRPEFCIRQVDVLGSFYRTSRVNLVVVEVFVMLGALVFSLRLTPAAITILYY